MSEINIIDVIAVAGPYSGGKLHYSVIVDRMPDHRYERSGNRLTAHDSGFYDFLSINTGTTKAFAGRAFTIELVDGSKFECKGQVWACGSSAPEPVVSIGLGTIEGLAKCHVYYGGYVSQTKLDAWLALNTPSKNQYKYDPRESIEWAEQRIRECGGKPVGVQRARKLRHRGTFVWRNATTNGLEWSPWFERKRTQILERQALDTKSQGVQV
nr:hypothetical protein [uncultured Rhodoferax sp.]